VGKGPAYFVLRLSFSLASRPLFRYLAVMIAGLLLVAFIPWITTVLPLWLDFKF